MATHYVRNELGDVHSVDEEHFLTVLHTTTRGGTSRLKPEFEEVDEATARKENPQLFGFPDLEIVRGMTSAEVREARERRAYEKELEAELAGETLDTDEPETEGETVGDSEAEPAKRRR